MKITLKKNADTKEKVLVLLFIQILPILLVSLCLFFQFTFLGIEDTASKQTKLSLVGFSFIILLFYYIKLYFPITVDDKFKNYSLLAIIALVIIVLILPLMKGRKFTKKNKSKSK